MATILTFRRNEQQVRKPRPEGTVCDIVFYTGVRYERDAHGGMRGLSDTRPSGRGNRKPTTKLG
jgi:hypothetical protein